jgi:biopolymer transport protein ExbB
VTAKRRCDFVGSYEAIMRRMNSGEGRRFAFIGQPWLRLAFGLALVWWAGAYVAHPALMTRLLAQEEKNPSVGAELTDETPAASHSTGAPAAKAPVKHRTFLDSIKAGGYIGVIIILMSVVAVAFVIEHSLSIRKQRLMPEAVLDELEELIARGDLPGAIRCCEDPRNYSLATDVVLAGLERFQSSEFGFADYKSAVEEAGEDHTARLYRKTDGLNIIGVIAPMLGLFGTVEGMMESFNIIASQEGAAQPYQLADSISKALVTTWLGLVVAIPSMVAFSYFRNKIDSLVSECGKRVERILTPLSRKR